jgi:predicted N-acetyltransferase YhbS
VLSESPEARIEIGIASPREYVDVEAMSRAASQHDVFTPLTVSLLEWFLDRNPCGPGFIVVARDASGSIVGHFVFYRWTLRQRTGGGVADVQAALYVRLYVAPAARRRGVFAAMTRFGLEHLRTLDVPVAYTAPNPRSSPGFVKFGMQRIGPLPFRLRPAVPGWAWIFGPGPAPRGTAVERRERFDDRFAARFDEHVPSAATLWSPRPAALMNWRYVDRPEVSYAIYYLRDGTTDAGYLITRRMVIKGYPVVALCDFWVAPGSEAALRAGVETALAEEHGVRGAIAIGAAADPRLTGALRRAGFVAVPPAVLPQPILIFGGAVDPSAHSFILPDDRTWYLTPHDWDVF